MSRIEVLLDYSVIGPRKRVTYRIVRDSEGHFRVDKKGIEAKTWRTACWGGDYESHYEHAVWQCLKYEKYLKWKSETTRRGSKP